MFYQDEGEKGAPLVRASANGGGGSVLKGTVFNRWESIGTHLQVDSDEPADKLSHLIRNAKAGCFAEGLITQQVPLHSHVEVNGKPFHIEGITAA